MKTLNIPDEFFDEYPNSLLQRDYTRVFDTINSIWGTLEGQDYLDGIVLMEHDHIDRAGFPFEVFLELAALHAIHIDISVTYCKDFTGWSIPSLNR